MLLRNDVPVDNILSFFDLFLNRVCLLNSIDLIVFSILDLMRRIYFANSILFFLL